MSWAGLQSHRRHQRLQHRAAVVIGWVERHAPRLYYAGLQLRPTRDDNWWPARTTRYAMRFRAFVGTLLGHIESGAGIWRHPQYDDEGKRQWFGLDTPEEFILREWGWRKWSYIQLVAADVWGTQYDFSYMSTCDGWRNWHIHIDETSTC